MRFRDRRQAGHALGERFRLLRADDPVVVGIARGGVVVAREIADVLGAPLDVLLIGKIEVPGRPGTELAAVGEGGVLVTNYDAAARLGMAPAELRFAANRERAELARRIKPLRQHIRRVPVGGRTVILTDDAVTTGATARAAIRVLRARGAHRVVLAVPFAPVAALDQLSRDADQIVCLRQQPTAVTARGVHGEFPPLTDEDALASLAPAPAPELIPA
ncbi:MAG TPA: phosphoribosyltransferase family protein [Amycolatopsis sp.]|uniref:phosphoribosyltransferase n=1 Tax=Amycolatopsis sp. TaxID=37632 RepID=UPI002B479827|nr:phosphoribosyltransferase family protein [Amycolatopsis sp.]HKS46914.1 phosphoribosyltransferase family protein [Amycolatopsis sp.]